MRVFRPRFLAPAIGSRATPQNIRLDVGKSAHHQLRHPHRLPPSMRAFRPRVRAPVIGGRATQPNIRLGVRKNASNTPPRLGHDDDDQVFH